jgi:hypothetical protein
VIINSQLATSSPTVPAQLTFTDVNGVASMALSTDGGVTFGATVAYGPAASLTLPNADGLYTVAVRITDTAGNTTVTSQSIRLDRSGPSISESLTNPTNNGSYDVGVKITLTYGATDVDSVSTITLTLDGAPLASSGIIDMDTLLPGVHTITITATDRLGNRTTTTVGFQVHATINGLINAVNDGASRGYITSTEQQNLVWQLQQAKNGNVKPKLSKFVSMVPADSGKTVTAAYAGLLVNWTNDLISRS